MTEERKQLIKILEPYMEKILNDGCLLYHNKYGFAKLQYGNIEVSLEGKLIALVDGKINWIPIGHYDISAVLKYIEKTNYYSLLNMGTYKEFIYFCEGDDSLNIDGEIDFEPLEFNIPNKPLHLYTQEEEFNLLKLLKDLGKQ